MRPLRKTKPPTPDEIGETSTASVSIASTATVTVSTNPSNSSIGNNPGTFIKEIRVNQKTSNNNDNDADDELDNIKVCVPINEIRKKSLKDMPNGTISLLECEKKFDPKKRYSIGNGDLRNGGKSYELTPSSRSMQRKLSADMRLRGSNSQLHEEYVIRRPVRLKSMTTNFEVYDSLHVRAVDVSTNIFFSLFLSIIYCFK